MSQVYDFCDKRKDSLKGVFFAAILCRNQLGEGVCHGLGLGSFPKEPRHIVANLHHLVGAGAVDAGNVVLQFALNAVGCVVGDGFYHHNAGAVFDAGGELFHIAAVNVVLGFQVTNGLRGVATLAV